MVTKPMKFEVAIVYRSFSDDSGRSEEATEPFRYFSEDVLYHTRILYHTRMVRTIRVWYVPYAYGMYHTRTVQFCIPYAYGMTIRVW